MSRSARRMGRRAVLIYLVLGFAALVASGVGTYLVSRAVARHQALEEAERSGIALADLVVDPLLTAVTSGDTERLAELDSAIARQIGRGGLMRVKVWDLTGKLLYCDEPELIGRRFPLSEAAERTIRENTTHAGISPLEEPENVAEVGNKMVEVYVPVELDGYPRLAFEAYFDYKGVQARTDELTSEMVPIVVGALAVLQLTQIPIALSLARRVARHQEERSQLLRRALSASDHERRLVATKLHDGVVQDLAGASYVLSAAEKSLPPAERELVGRGRAALQEAVSALRTAMVEIYPPDLAEGGLGQAMDDLAAPLRGDGTRVVLDLAIPDGLSAPVAAALYRLTREAFRNVIEHAHATRVDVRLRCDGPNVLLRIDDNGVGLPATGTDRRAEGHLGLRLLADSMVELGGRFRARTRPEGGTSIQVSLPATLDDGR